MDHNKPIAPCNLADEFAAQTREAERTYIASLWLNPVVGHDAAVKARLAGADFFDPHHSWLFCYLCLCAENNLDPLVGEAVRLAKRDGLDFIDAEIFNLVLETRTHRNMADVYATTVKLYARKRRIASKHLKRIGKILNSEGFDHARSEKTTIRYEGHTQGQANPDRFGERQRRGRDKRTFDARLA